MLGELRAAIDSRLSTSVLESCTSLLSMPAIKQQADEVPTQYGKAVVLREILRSLLNRHDPEWLALQELADLTTTRPRSAQQRQVAAAQVLRPGTPYSTRHVRRIYQEQLLPKLLIALDHYNLDVQSGQWAAQVEAIEAGQLATTPLLIPPYLVEEIEGTWRFEGRYPRQMLEVWTIRALRDGLSTFLLMNQYLHLGTRLGGVEISVGGQAYLENINETPDGTYAIVAGFPPVAVNQLVRIRLGIRFQGDIPGCQVYGFCAGQPARRLSVAIEFDPDNMPAGVWRLNGIRPNLPAWKIVDEVRTEPADAAVSKVGYCQEAFTDMVADRTYGLAWMWP